MSDKTFVIGMAWSILFQIGAWLTVFIQWVKP